MTKFIPQFSPALRPPCPSCTPVDTGPVPAAVIDATVIDGAPAKPPAQVAGVKGIDASAVMQQPSRIDWQKLASLPPFQMWAAEHFRSEFVDRDSCEHAHDVIRRLGADESVYRDYARWHAARGCWPNETPMGEAK